MTPERQSKAARVGVCAPADWQRVPGVIGVGKQQRKLLLHMRVWRRKDKVCLLASEPCMAVRLLTEQGHTVLLRMYASYQRGRNSCSCGCMRPYRLAKCTRFHRSGGSAVKAAPADERHGPGCVAVGEQ